MRDNILLRQTLVKWQTAHQYQLDLPNTADAHLVHHLQSQALQKWIRQLKDQQLLAKEEARTQKSVRTSWQGWRMNLIQRRTKRWQRDMRGRERDFVGKKENALLGSIFQVSLCA